MRYSLLQEANCFLTLTLLSGGQSPESSNCSTDYRIYKLQVCDNIHDILNIQWVIMIMIMIISEHMSCVFSRVLPVFHCNSHLFESVSD